MAHWARCFMDKTFWRAVRDSDFAVPAGHALPDLTEELLGWLGSPDPVLRDETAYVTLAHWLSRGHYPPDALLDMGRRMVQNLRQGLGEVGTDSVFLRAFSVLILGEVVAVDGKRPEFVRSLLEIWRMDALSYFFHERDVRGFVDGRGWAHALAHAADCLGAFAAHPSTDAQGLESLLDSVADRLLERGAEVFIYGEDERLASACLQVLRRTELSGEAVDRWLGRFRSPGWAPTWLLASGSAPGARTYANVKAFLRSTYFQLRWTSTPPVGVDGIVETIVGTLRAVDTGFYDVP